MASGDHLPTNSEIATLFAKQVSQLTVIELQNLHYWIGLKAFAPTDQLSAILP